MPQTNTVPSSPTDNFPGQIYQPESKSGIPLQLRISNVTQRSDRVRRMAFLCSFWNSTQMLAGSKTKAPREVRMNFYVDVIRCSILNWFSIYPVEVYLQSDLPGDDWFSLLEYFNMFCILAKQSQEKESQEEANERGGNHRHGMAPQNSCRTADIICFSDITLSIV